MKKSYFRIIRKVACFGLVAVMSASLMGCVGNSSSVGESAVSDSSVTDETTIGNETNENEEETTTEAESEFTIPEISIEAKDVPSNEGTDFVKALKLGVSLGNTFDAYSGCGYKESADLSMETVWQSAVTTREIIRSYHDAGFDTIRIPVSWHNHLVDDDYTISEKWLNRVYEVVGWALDEGMYVIINIHHDNDEGFGCFYPDSEHLEQSKHYIERIWTQLCDKFGEFDEHLIFESMNEPRLVGHNNEWWIAANDDCRDAIVCINELNQLFVDTVRASGGNNASRFLMCPGYDASPDGALNTGYVLPTDSDGLENHILVSVHAYTPYNFALEYPGTTHFDETSASSTKDINTFMNNLYVKFISKGVPVVIGEFGARGKIKPTDVPNTQDRINFAAYYVAYARACGMSCMWWDNNSFSGNGENFGLLYRVGNYIFYPEIMEAMLKYCE